MLSGLLFTAFFVLNYAQVNTDRIEIGSPATFNAYTVGARTETSACLVDPTSARQKADKENMATGHQVHHQSKVCPHPMNLMSFLSFS